MICRFRYEGIKVDVMAAKPMGWAPANPWFEPGFAHLETNIVEGKIIRLLSLPYFLASKYAAFQDRGSKDPRTSHDLEDVTYILDNRVDLVEILTKAPADVLQYLRGAFQKILKDSVMQEAIIANLYYETQSERFEMIIDKIKQIVQV